jgi:hypothetical protein
MKANLYIHPDAIKHNGLESEYDYISKFKLLIDDLIEIKTSYSDDNTIYVSDCLSNCNLYENNGIFEVASKLGYEEKNFIYSIAYNTSSESSLSLNQIRNLCKYQKNEQECNSVIYLYNPVGAIKKTSYISFDEYVIVCGTDTWHTLRRQIIGNHPGSPDDFISECKIHFPDIVFHDNCILSIGGYLNTIPRKIVYYLSCMNDKLLEFKMNSGIKDVNTLLERFCTEYGFDEAGSLQRTSYKKSLYTFNFLKCGCEEFDSKRFKSITCDPHMKISSDDNKSPICARIYFHFGDDEIATGKILVGSIGPHVK